MDRNKSKPFFLFLAFNAVHSPMHALNSDRDRFRDVKNGNRRTCDGMLLAMDRAIGCVLKRLDQHGLSEKSRRSSVAARSLPTTARP
ncbi:MAG: sulfatase-like hydrolase/transferase [Fuerstiella sp.]|nr:sulfatase-like hydrolase/transferase [Fuerstiella sp.]MCP4854843.1 sulfatase-like hydrolase/transferase [Fuerstiella sp.]